MSVNSSSALRDSFRPLEQDDHVESYSCRFCLDEGTRRDFIAPCNCSGTSKWVHRSCLDRWRSTREDKAFSQCTECHAYYDMICVTNDTWQDSCCRRVRFCAYFTRDVSLIIILSQVVVLLVSAFVYLVDLNGHSLFHLSKMHDAFSFYYLAGWFLTLAIIGMMALCFRNQCCDSCSNSRNDIYCNDIVCCVDPTPGCIYCGPCESCTSCECAQCTAVSCGEEMLGIALVVGIILAVIGVFVSVVFGIIILQHIVRRHVSILNKWNLTREYIVRDLAPGALSMDELVEERLQQNEAQHHRDQQEPDANAYGPFNSRHQQQNFVSRIIYYLSGGSYYDPPAPARTSNSSGSAAYDYRSLPSSRSHFGVIDAADVEESGHFIPETVPSNSIELVPSSTFNPMNNNSSSAVGSMNRQIAAHDEETAASAPPMVHLSAAQRLFLQRNHLLN